MGQKILVPKEGYGGKRNTPNMMAEERKLREVRAVE